MGKGGYLLIYLLKRTMKGIYDCEVIEPREEENRGKMDERERERDGEGSI